MPLTFGCLAQVDLRLTALEEVSHLPDGFFINPAFNVLAMAFYCNNACLAKFLDVVGHRRGSDVQLFPQLTDVPPGLFYGTSTGSRRADRKEAQEDSESTGTCKGFEHLRIPAEFLYSIN